MRVRFLIDFMGVGGGLLMIATPCLAVIGEVFKHILRPFWFTGSKDFPPRFGIISSG